MAEQGIDRFSRLLHREINTTLKRGSLWATLLGLSSGVIIFSLEFTGLVHDFSVPGIWASICGLFSLFAFMMARHGAIHGWVQYAVFLPFISLPSILFTMSYFLLPSGTATYITGPASYLYFFVIIMTGFVFNRRLSIVGGVLVGAQYLIAYMLGSRHLEEISCPDPLMLQDLTAPPVYFFKSMMMVFAGVVVGVLSSNTRKLISEILREEQEKHEAERKKDMIKDLFGRYVAEEVRDEVLSGRIPLDGEMKDVTVLFADLRDFTPMTESLGPKAVVKIINRYFQEMAEAIQGQGGLILQFLGDEIYAVFGAPQHRPDHPVRALRAGTEMRRRLAYLNERLAAEGAPQLKHGIGIHTGEALAANIGSPDRLSYLLVGDTINLASRLQTLTKEMGTEMIISAETYERLSPNEQTADRLQKLPATRVKGKSRPVEIYTVA